MIKKKNNPANLEKKRVLYFELGALIALTLMLVAFEWGTTETNTLDLSYTNSTGKIESNIISTIRKPIKTKAPLRPTEIIIINDTKDEIEDIDIDWGEDINKVDDYFFGGAEEDDENIEDTPKLFVQNMPTYHGQNYAYFQKHLQELVRYPIEAQNNGVEGKVTLKFVVNKQGKIVNATILQSPHPSLSEAVLSAVKKTDNWTPGEQLGIKVKVQFIIPVYFKIN